MIILRRKFSFLYKNKERFEVDIKIKKQKKSQ